MPAPIDVKAQFQTVFNNETKKPEIVTPDELKAGGNKYSPIEDQATVKMIGPENKVVDVPGDTVDQAIGSGYRFEHPVSDQMEQEQAANKAQALQEAKGSQLQRILEAANPIGGRIESGLLGPVKNGPDLGGPGVFAEKTANQLALNLPEAIEDYTKTPEQKEAIETVNAQHPTAALLGNIVGFAGSLPLYAGGVGAIGKGVEGLVAGKDAIQGAAAAPEIANAAEQAFQGGKDISLARSLAAKTLGSAAEGAALTAPQALVQASYGDPEKAAETLAWGIGPGAVLGLGGGVLGEAGSAASNALSKVKGSDLLPSTEQGSWLNNKAYETILRKLGFTAKKLENAGGMDAGVNIVDTMMKEDTIPDIANASYDQVQNFIKKAGEDIGEHYKAADALMSKDPKLASQGFNPINAATKFENMVTQSMPLINTPIMASTKSAMDSIMDTIIKGEGEDARTMTFDEAQKLKNGLADQAKEAWNDQTVATPIKQLKKLAATAVREEEISAFSRVMDTNADGGLKTTGKLLNDMNRYRVSKQVGDVVDEIDRKSFGKVLPGVGVGASGLGLKSLLGIDIMGHALSSVMGPLAYPLSALANHLAGHWAVDKGLPTAAKWILKQAKSPEAAPYIGGLLAKDGTEALQAKLSQLPDILSGSAKLGAIRAVDPLKNFLGDRANGVSKDKQYDLVAKQLTNVAANPQSVIQAAGQMATLFQNDPRLAQLLAQKQYQQLTYLQSQLPKNPSPPQPFQKNEWKPSPQQKQAFLDKLEVATNPWSAVEHIKDGSLSQAHVDALTAMYPKIKDEISNAAVAMAYDPRSPHVSNGVQHGISMLTGQPLGTYAYTNFQAAYQNTANQQPPPAGGTGGGKKRGRPAGSGSHTHLKNEPSLATPMQEVQRTGK